MENGADEMMRKRRSGRPRALDPRTNVTKLRTNASEDEIIKAGAIEACLPLATYIRKRALSEATRALPRVDSEAAAQLARLGHLFDQAVKLCQAGNSETWPAAEAEHLRDLCGQISVRLTGGGDSPSTRQKE